MPQPNSSSFTFSPGARLRAISTPCAICQAFDPTSGGAHPPLMPFDGIWDTGATSSVITQVVVDRCRLAPVGMTQVRGVHGAKVCEVFLVNIALPNNVAFAAIPVTKADDLAGANVLIGMDIISMGDFAITNKNGATTFSFRYPSEACIDFVKEHHTRLQAASGGSGGTPNSDERRRARRRMARASRRKNR